MRKRYFLVALVNSTRGSPLRYSSDLNRAVDKTLNRQGLVVQRDSKLLFSTSRLRFDQSDAEIARLPSQKALRDQESTFEHDVSQQKGKQIRTPWHREGSDLPPVQRLRSAGAMTKGTEVSIIHQRRCCVCTETAYYVTRHSVADLGAGKLLTTPSRLLKLILPLTTLDKNSDRKDVEPLALLVHPQQPLSYLERLIQSELPTIKGPEGKDKIPAVHFRAEDSGQDESDPTAEDAAEKEQKQEAEGDTSGENMEETRFDGKVEKTGKINRKKQQEVASLRGGPGEGGVESYSGRGREADSTEGKERKFVRWSTSTEIGDFIRDAARGKEFAVEIEGTAQEIRVGVPSFNDRTHYLRMRLQKTSRKILDMAAIKKECDTAAHTGAQRIALGGFGVLVAWWYAVYRLTFETDLGWDTMEPVTVSVLRYHCKFIFFILTRLLVPGRSFWAYLWVWMVPVPQ